MRSFGSTKNWEGEGGGFVMYGVCIINTVTAKKQRFLLPVLQLRNKWKNVCIAGNRRDRFYQYGK